MINDKCKRAILRHISGFRKSFIEKMKDNEVLYHFNRLIFTEIKRLLDTIGISGSSG